MYVVRIINVPNTITLHPEIDIVKMVKSMVAHSAEPVKAIFKASSIGCISIKRASPAEQDTFCGGAKYCSQNCFAAMAKPSADKSKIITEYM